jgi:hypothetical protein
LLEAHRHLGTGVGFGFGLGFGFGFGLGQGQGDRVRGRIRARGGLVRVRLRVRDRVRAGVTVAAGNSQQHGITMFRPGFAILVYLPNCSISVTVPVFTVTQGRIPHDIARGCW